MPLAQLVGSEVGRLDRRALGDERQLGLVQLVARDNPVLSAGARPEVVNGMGEGGRDEVVKEGPPGRGAQRECLRPEQGAAQHGLIQVVPGRQVAAPVPEQQFLGRCRAADLVPCRAQEAFDLGGRRQADVLYRERGLGAVHDHQPGYQRFLGDPSGDEREIHGLLHVAGKQDEPAGIGAQVHGIVAAARCAAVSCGGLGDEVQYERHMPAGRRGQQVLRCRGVGTGQERGGAATREREARRGGDDAPGSVGGIGRQRFTEQVGAAAIEFAQPHRIRRPGWRCTAEHRVTGDRGLRQCDGRVAVEHGVEALLANVGPGRCAERLAIPADGEIANAAHRATSMGTASWSWNCSPSSQTMAFVGQRNIASGAAGPPAA